MRRRFALLALAAACVCAHAADPAPEIHRDPAPPQATGAAHTVRAIPEACTRIEGVFTGDGATPYRMAAVRTSAQCRPRARFVDGAKAAPSASSGWILNDIVRIPHAACARQHAIVRVWRKPGDAAPPKLDAQGRARLYLGDAQQAAASIPAYAAVVEVDGRCG
ncbi:hypothetical protein SD81_028395 [Tolypothrix campylonemoides VB511288]|nr:hypothetical protein SD81_028395 [Tolypothrix campylonemoides VB511288]